MLPLARPKVESTTAADRNSDATTQTRRQQQAREQCEAAAFGLDAAVSNFRRSHGKEHSAELRGSHCRRTLLTPGLSPVCDEHPRTKPFQPLCAHIKPLNGFTACRAMFIGLKTDVNKKFLSHLRGCGGRGFRRCAELVAFTKELSDHFFYRHFLHIDVTDIASFENSPACFSHLRAGNF